MEQIKFDKRNYRSNSDKNKATIRRSLEECGAGRSVVIDSEGELIAANINQDTLSREYGKQITFERFMKDAFKTKSKLLPLIGE